MRFAYYPGCSLESSAREYDESLRDLFAALGMELVEVPGWSCCGASSAHQLDPFLAVALPGRDLLKAEEMGLDLVVPCAACFLRLREARKALLEDGELARRFEAAMGKAIRGTVRVLHPLEVVAGEEVRRRLRAQVKTPLSGLKAVCYYGCYLVRPPEVTGIDDPEDPHVMEGILEDAGVEVLDWAWKVDCCGGSHSLLRPEIVRELSQPLARRAKEAGADVIVVACPLCQANLELYQGREGVPVLYFSEVLAMALGIEGGRWLSRHLVKAKLPLGGKGWRASN